MYDRPYGAIFNDLERPLPPVSGSRHYLSLNIPETAKDTAIVAIEDEYETIPRLSSGTILNDLE